MRATVKMILFTALTCLGLAAMPSFAATGCAKNLTDSPSDDKNIPVAFRGIMEGTWSDGSCAAFTLVTLYQNGKEGQVKYFSGRRNATDRFSYTLTEQGLIVHFDNSASGNQMVFTVGEDKKLRASSHYKSPRTGLGTPDLTGTFEKIGGKQVAVAE